MKKFAILITFFLIIAFVLPLTVFYVMKAGNKDIDKQNEDKTTISVFFHNEGVTRTMAIDEYLCGVVSAEMPASFEKEALKAQAVAARSYAMYRKKNPSPDHLDADVCTDFSHCKAYKNPNEQVEIWGEDAEKFSGKINSAVYETSGEVITYNGEVALAVFHSQSSGGRTENSSDVWGGNIPYLVSVESHGEENAPNFYSTVSVSFAEFQSKLKEKYPDILIESTADIGQPQLSEGGNVNSIAIGGKSIKGKEIRTLFDLRSSCFRIITDGEKITFEVTGYGHGVGMSQYGANTMAQEGYNYIQILTHYYSGTQIEGV